MCVRVQMCTHGEHLTRINIKEYMYMCVNISVYAGSKGVCVHFMYYSCVNACELLIHTAQRDECLCNNLQRFPIHLHVRP